MEEALLAFLLARPTGEMVEGRIAWSEIPQGQGLPFLALHLVSAPRDYTMDGRINLVPHLVQMDCWGGTHLEAKQLARALEADLAALPAATDGRFQGASIENERADFQQGQGPGPSGASNFFRTSLDVQVWHRPLP